MKTIALVVGHKRTSPGACHPPTRECEFEYNSGLALDIAAEISGEFRSVIVNRRTYRGLPTKINKHKPSVILSLHCNAFNRRASGCETLYYHRSGKGQALATLVQRSMVSVLGNKDRGIKPKASEDRGGYLLRNTKAPCVIIEPFFIDNSKDFLLGRKHKSALAKILAESLEVYLR